MISNRCRSSIVPVNRWRDDLDAAGPVFVDETRNAWGKGEVSDIGFMPGDALVEKIVARGVERAGVTPGVRFPIVARSGRLKNGHIVRYIPNCSATEQKPANPGAGTDLLHDRRLLQSERVTLEP